MIDENIDIQSLKSVDIFADLNFQELERIAGLAHSREYKSGSVIFYEGDPGEAMYYVKNGKIKISKDAYDGREQILHIMRAGDVFGEVVLFDDRSYPATAEVMENSEVGVITKESFDRYLTGNPQIALKMMKLLGKRLRIAQSKVADMALKDTYRRTISMLYNLMEEHRESTQKKGSCTYCDVIQIPLTHQELASMIGTTRESVTRVFASLKNEGIIKTDKGYIMILNPDKLRQKVLE